MKLLMTILLGMLIFWLIFFKLDPIIVNYILSLIPESANEWLNLIKLVVWIIIICLTGSIGIALTIYIPLLFYVLTGKN